MYLFREGSKEQKYVLGGKGANLAEMTNIGLPVPPGEVSFSIETDLYRYQKLLVFHAFVLIYLCFCSFF